MNRKVIIILTVIIGVVVLCCGCGAAAFFLSTRSENSSDNVSGNNDVKDVVITEGKMDLNIDSIYRDNIDSLEPEDVLLGEVELVVDGLKLLESKGWDGNPDNANVKFSDLDENRWELYKQDDEESLEGLTIPTSLRSIYTSSDAQEEIEELTFRIRKEYLEALKQKGVDSKYIQELDKHVMPDDKSRYEFYFNNEPEDMPTQVEGYRGGEDIDYTKHQMHLNVIDFHNGARLLRASGVLGEASKEPTTDMRYEKALRDMAMRWYIYHELTHSLQRAYMNLHVSDDYKNTLIAYRDYENTLIFIDESYLWKWGNPEYTDAPAENFDISTESQAEGIAYQLLTEGYDMSPAQRKAVWDHLFGRLEGNLEKLLSIKQTFETKYPDLNPRDMPRFMEGIEDSVPASERSQYDRFMGKIVRMAAYAGYFNPLRPQDTDKFWDKLR